MQTVRACLALAFTGQVFLSDAIFLRQQNVSVAPRDSKMPSIGALAKTQLKKPEGEFGVVSHEVTNKTSIKRETTSDCLCKMGSFWHWRIKSCVKQGGWGYECGFFPAEHHDKVCQDGLKCEPLDQNRVKYFHPGAIPASCQTCEPQDQCLYGETRHSQSCLKEFKLTGEACQTVAVKIMATAEVQVEEKVTKSGTASKDGTKAKAEATSSAEAKASATKQGVAEGSACVTVEEIKEMLNLKNVPRIGAVLSANVVSAADAEAFDRAYAEALKAAKEAGLLSAQEAARALAQAKAREHAGLDAEAKANEAAAWKAEAGAKQSAQDAAKAKSLDQSGDAADKNADQAAADAAAADANANAAEKKAADANAAAGGGGAGGGSGSGSGGSDDAAAKAKADKAAQDAAAAKAEAERKKAEAAQAKAAADAIRDVVSPSVTDAPQRPTTPKPTGPPRKITPDQIAAKLP